MGEGKVKCVVIAEGELEREVHTFNSRAEFEAFSSGVYLGAGLYGAGGCGVYDLEGLKELLEDGGNGMISKADMERGIALLSKDD